VPIKPLETVAAEMPSPRVFFTDRASPGALRLARAANDRGAIVVFEPSGVGEPRHFQGMLELTHVLKYSRERLPSIGGPSTSRSVLLEVQTLGTAGVRFRSRLPRFRAHEWQHMDAYEVPELRDASGSGDWCTAGILHLLARGGLVGLARLSRRQVMAAVSFGQALAAWNCRFIGARGGMYMTTAAECLKSVRAITNGAVAGTADAERVDAATAKLLQNICGTCQGA